MPQCGVNARERRLVFHYVNPHLQSVLFLACVESFSRVLGKSAVHENRRATARSNAIVENIIFISNRRGINRVAINRVAINRIAINRIAINQIVIVGRSLLDLDFVRFVYRLSSRVSSAAKWLTPVCWHGIMVMQGYQYIINIG